MADVKKCDWCERVQREDEDPSCEWFTVADGIATSRVSDDELCSKDCVIAWLDWRAEVRADITEQLAKDLGTA